MDEWKPAHLQVMDYVGNDLLDKYLSLHLHPDFRNKKACSLTLLERKRLELARALAGNPKLLLLDEIAGGLTPHECEELVAAILKVRQTGVAIIWIEHVVHALLATIDRLMVLHQGRKLMDGDPKTVMAMREVREIYLGVEADA